MSSEALEMMEMPGGRVRLRPWQRRDALAQESWPRYTDPFSTLWNLPRGADDLFDDLNRSLNITPRKIWAVEDRQRRLIGRISLRDINPEAASARLGISLGAPFVGQGLGSEALTIFLDLFFGPLGFQIMLLDVAAFNRRAVRCYERLGFQHVGSDWRDAGGDSSLRLLDDPRHRDLLPFFRRGLRGAQVEFLEMELHDAEWLRRRVRPR